MAVPFDDIVALWALRDEIAVWADPIVKLYLSFLLMLRIGNDQNALRDIVCVEAVSLHLTIAFNY